MEVDGTSSPSPSSADQQSEPAAVRFSCSRRAAWCAAIAVWLVVMAVTYRSPAAVVSPFAVPDWIEYAVGAQRLATLGRYDIVVDGVAHPPRYPPGYSCLIAPAYFVAPDNVVAGIWISRAVWSAGFAALAYALARRFGLGTAVLTTALLVVHPMLQLIGTLVISDAPTLAALLGLIAIRLLKPVLTPASALACGLLVALAAGCRPQAVSFVLLFAPEFIRHGRRLMKACLLLVPPAGVAVAVGIYNHWTFGSFSMNGYVYWCPLPYSRLDYVFHLTYLAEQIAGVVADPWLSFTLLAGFAAIIRIAVNDRASRKALLWPAILAVAPLTAAHAIYFFPQARLFAPLVVVCVLCVGIAVGMACSRVKTKFGLHYVLAAIVMASSWYFTVTTPLTPALAILTQMKQSLPDRCRVITLYESPLFESIVGRGSHRQWVSATRAQEYSNKLIASAPLDLTGIPRPPPLDHLAPLLFARGGRLAVVETADDDALLDRLADPNEPPTYIDAHTITMLPALRERLERRFKLEPLANARLLARCVPREVPREGDRSSTARDSGS